MVNCKIKFTKVYRINGRLVVADSIEEAIKTWRESPGVNTTEIYNIEKVCSDTNQCVCKDALIDTETMIAEAEEILRLSAQRDKYIADLKERDARLFELEKEIEQIKSGNNK